MSAMPSTPHFDPSKDAVARRLAAAHGEVDRDISVIFRIEAPGKEADPSEPIKLLEVSPNTSASGIVPVGLSAHAPSGIFYPSIIVEIHSSEWEALQQGRLKLPNGWSFNPKQPLWGGK